jgi:xylulokinase
MESYGMAYIGVDIGTTGVRAGVYDHRFNLLGTGGGESIIRRGPENEIIQDPEEMYRETASAVREAVRKSGVKPDAIEAMSFDGQMAGIMGIDEEWQPVTPYDSWLDTRCAEQVRTLEESARGKMIEKTGSIPSYNHGPKMMWWKQNRPEEFNRVGSFIQPAAYVAGRLCGLRGEQAFIDWTYLHFSGLADNRALAWDEELTGLLGIPREKLPRIVSPLDQVGEANAAEAEG